MQVMVEMCLMAGETHVLKLHLLVQFINVLFLEEIVMLICSALLVNIVKPASALIQF